MARFLRKTDSIFEGLQARQWFVCACSGGHPCSSSPNELLIRFSTPETIPGFEHLFQQYGYFLTWCKNIDILLPEHIIVIVFDVVRQL